MGFVKLVIIFFIGLYIGYNSSYRNIVLDCPKSLERIANILIKQSARWSAASGQDKSPLISVLHANYGMGYLMALKDILSPSEIEKYTKINIKKFEKEINNAQDNATMMTSKNCPNYASNLNLYLAKIAREVN